MDQLRQYELERKLGEGTYGAVYLGYLKDTYQKVAIKFINTKGKLESALREVRLLSALDHQNVLKIYNHFTFDGDINGHSFDLVIIMEFVEGIDLRKFLKMSDRVRFASMYFRQLTSALSYLHEHCVVHQDIKPENIVVNQERAVLIDFGLGCKECAPECGICDRNVKCTHSIAGTLKYFSPQKIRAYYEGHFDKKKDDVWALGKTIGELYEGIPNMPSGDTVVIRRMLDVNEDTRTSATEAFADLKLNLILI